MNKEPKDLRDMTDEELDQRILELEWEIRAEEALLDGYDPFDDGDLD